MCKCVEVCVSIDNIDYHLNKDVTGFFSRVDVTINALTNCGFIITEMVAKTAN